MNGPSSTHLGRTDEAALHRDPVAQAPLVSFETHDGPTDATVAAVRVVGHDAGPEPDHILGRQGVLEALDPGVQIPRGDPVIAGSMEFGEGQMAPQIGEHYQASANALGLNGDGFLHDLNTHGAPPVPRFQESE